tara:strand:- start:500 stop:1633 length:1134 start_codon:yes stop_codon:yes gene_type:complete
MEVPFNKSPYCGIEEIYIREAIQNNNLSGDGKFSKQCQVWFEKKYQCPKTLMTPSCTAALEMTAQLIDIQPGDEVIMPSYTFVSTANAFALRGAKIVFVDIRSDTMNIDENLIEAAITNRTKAIVPVHYAGVSCDMDPIMYIAEKYKLYVIEDAAQAMLSEYKGRFTGTIGHFGTLSFHDSKNYTSGGEGGLLIINDNSFIQRAEIIREKGTNRSEFYKGLTDKYTWVDLGSSYLPGEIQCAYLWGQLEYSEKIKNDRLRSWQLYFDELSPLLKKQGCVTPTIPAEIKHNGHMFYIKLSTQKDRDDLIAHLRKRKITAPFHYIPLHSSPAGQKFGYMHAEDLVTTKESSKLIRLPLYYNITEEEIDYVIKHVKEFFG